MHAYGMDQERPQHNPEYLGAVDSKVTGAVDCDEEVGHRHQNVHVRTPPLTKVRPCQDAKELQ